MNWKEKFNEPKIDDWFMLNMKSIKDDWEITIPNEHVVYTLIHVGPGEEDYHLMHNDGNIWYMDIKFLLEHFNKVQR